MAIADKDGDGEVDYTELVKMTEDKDRLEAQAELVLPYLSLHHLTSPHLTSPHTGQKLVAQQCLLALLCVLYSRGGLNDW